MLKISDYILIITLLIFAFSFNFIFVKVNSAKSADVVVVTVDGKEYESFPLDTNDDYTLETGKDKANINSFTVENGKVRMTHANCPDQYCVDTKAIQYNSQTIVCLPNKVVLEIKSDDPDKEYEIDSFVQ